MLHLFAIPQFMTFYQWTFARAKFIKAEGNLARPVPKALPFTCFRSPLAHVLGTLSTLHSQVSLWRHWPAPHFCSQRPSSFFNLATSSSRLTDLSMSLQRGKASYQGMWKKEVEVKGSGVEVRSKTHRHAQFLK